MKRPYIIGLVILVMIVCVVCFGSEGRGVSITVSATVKIPSDDDYYLKYNGGYKDIEIQANDEAYIAEGSHDAPFRRTNMKNGILKCGFGYGPAAIRGSISKDKLLQACPSLPLHEDWNFSLGMFNTESGNNRINIYLNLVIYADSMTSKATLYWFSEGSAHPEIREEDAAIGEEFGFPIEY